jgi:hypothetical protein
MADATSTEQPVGCCHGLRRTLLKAAVVGIVLFDFWLMADQEVAVEPGPYDQSFFLEKANCGYWFDEGYSHISSFLKEPTYPLFVAACQRLGLPLRLGHEALYLAAAGFVGWSLVYRQTRAEVGLLLFAVLALLPMHFFVFQSVLHDSIYTSLLMLALGSLLLQFKRRHEPGRWRRWLESGLALGLLMNTRAEHLLTAVPLSVLLGADAVCVWRCRPTWWRAARSWLGEWAPPLAIASGITLAIMTANYQRWGVFTVSELQAPRFNAAYWMRRCSQGVISATFYRRPWRWSSRRPGCLWRGYAS